MKLTAQDIGSPLWAKLVAHYQPLLAKYRARIESPRISEPERIELAWRISGIKEFLILGDQETEK